MSLAPSSYASLYSPPPLPRTNQNPFLFSQNSHVWFKKNCFLSTSGCSCNTLLVKPSVFVAKASETEAQASPEAESGSEEQEEKYEEYEVEIEQPYGLKFAKGRDGGTYIDAIAPGGSADKTGMFQVGDKVLATSAVFGTEIWPAAEYGRTMYTIRQRVGPLLMKMQKRYGKMEQTGELSEKEIIRAERNSGVISNRVREIQMQNYMKKKEQKERREQDLREGLQLYRIAKKNTNYPPKHYKIVQISPSNNECCEQKHKSYTKPSFPFASFEHQPNFSPFGVKAGLSALEDALLAGYEDFK
ncbi:hypothetical protein CUMW_180370, partial [Citrus unshiu]